MTIYISGPMSGMPDWNYPAFNSTAMRLRGQGHDVLNPAENFGGDPGHNRSAYMRADIMHVLQADAVAVLPGWQNSRGAKLEVAIAREISIPVLDADTLSPIVVEAKCLQI